MLILHCNKYVAPWKTLFTIKLIDWSDKSDHLSGFSQVSLVNNDGRRASRALSKMSDLPLLRARALPRQLHHFSALIESASAARVSQAKVLRAAFAATICLCISPISYSCQRWVCKAQEINTGQYIFEFPLLYPRDFTVLLPREFLYYSLSFPFSPKFPIFSLNFSQFSLDFSQFSLNFSVLSLMAPVILSDIYFLSFFFCVKIESVK